MNAIEKLFPVSQQERSFQLKVRRDAGTLRPAGCSRNLLNVKNAAAAPPASLDQKPVCMPQLRGASALEPITGSARFWTTEPLRN